MLGRVSAMTTVDSRFATLMVSETFKTVQGEGPSTGRLASFIRFGGCNLQCSWCDTPYTWDARRFDLRKQMARRTVDDLVAEVRGHGTRLVVLTGGEPLLHQEQPAWQRLLECLETDIEVETNGTRRPNDDTTNRCRFNVSPKLAHAGDPAGDRIVPAVLADLVATRRAVFKFVVRSVADFPEVRAIRDAVGIPDHLIWIMPEGTRPSTATPAPHLADAVVDAGWNLTARLHVIMWGNQKGR